MSRRRLSNGPPRSVDGAFRIRSREVSARPINLKSTPAIVGLEEDLAIISAQGQAEKTKKSRISAKIVELLTVPELTSAKKIRESTRDITPEFPMYTVSSKMNVEGIGVALFGEHGFDTVGSYTEVPSLGPQFTAFRGILSPWTLYSDRSGLNGYVESVFLNGEAWKQFVAPHQIPREEEIDRTKISRAAIISAEKIYQGIIDEGGTNILVWNGTLDNDSAPPAVIDFHWYSGLGKINIYGRKLMTPDVKIPDGLIQV